MSRSEGTILVVDDDAGQRQGIEMALTAAGYAVRTAATAAEARAGFEPEKVDVILQDLKMPDADGIDLLKEYRERDPEAVVMILTAYASWETVVEAMRLGAFDYIGKGGDTDLKATVARGVHLRRRLRKGSRREVEEFLSRRMVGHSKKIRQLQSLTRRAAAGDSTVLIHGESGTGKELVARALHYGSPRSAEPFVTVNCAAFTETLLESELFGHKRGSFTGAVVDKRGLVETADKGAFFLDEVGEMSMGLQVKLLRLLEEKEFIPVGGTSPKRVDVRFIAATNRDLEGCVREGTFREDLYYRLNVIPIRVPPLRERKEDVPHLAGHFLNLFARQHASRVHRIEPEAKEVLMRYDWPGNIRELASTVQRAVALAEGETIGVDDLDERLLRSHAVRTRSSLDLDLPESGFDLEREIARVERSYIEKALAETEGNVTRAADRLGISFRSLRYKIKKLGIR